MELNRQIRRQLRIHNIVYCLLLIMVAALLGWLSVRYSMEADWSAQNRNTLNQASIEMLAQLQEPLKITVFIAEDEVTRNPIRQLIGRYQHYKKDLELVFVNPEMNPAQVRALGVNTAGEIIIEYQGRQERLQQLSEETFTNTLQRLARGGERWIVFIGGHGERDPEGQQNHNLSELAARLTD
ncbi:MAG TPA: Gldg family protein, partial [Gammaproteobacteria bacterium]